MKCFLALALLLFCACSGGNNAANALGPSGNVAFTPPKPLLVYYGWPSLLNGAANGGVMAKVIADFAQYDYVVLGAGLEEPTHGDHVNTESLLKDPLTVGTTFFGYVDLGVSTNNHSMTTIKAKVDAWIATGADGIFFDDFGYDFDVTRARQNEAVDYVHAKGLPLIANAWVPADVFGAAYDATYNPGALPARLNAGDYYLCESYQITVGGFQTETDWQTKVAALQGYRENLAFKVLTLTTNDAANLWSEAKFHYAWYSALLYGFEAVGWGEYKFAAITCNAPFRQPQAPACGTAFTGEVAAAAPLYSRTTDTGLVWVNAESHLYGFEPR